MFRAVQNFHFVALGACTVSRCVQSATVQLRAPPFPSVEEKMAPAGAGAEIAGLSGDFSETPITKALGAIPGLIFYFLAAFRINSVTTAIPSATPAPQLSAINMSNQ